MALGVSVRSESIIWSAIMERGDHVEYLDINWRIILKWVLD
jgi:hypothetical protein